jgi:UDP-N-acetylmuramoyl-tripeptide--D-alanyl-D-alanine ligase
VAIITTVEAVHLEAFSGVEEIAAAKAEIFLGLEPDGVAILNRDNPQFELLARLAKAAGVARIVSFGEHPDAEARLDELVLEAEGSTISATILGRELTYFLGAPGRHLVQNSLAVLAAATLLGRDPEEAAGALAGALAPAGRGERNLIVAEGGSALLIDESYNANPASMKAAIALLGQNQPAAGGLRIAVLGDMLELGAGEADLHAALLDPLLEAKADRVDLAGPRRAALWEVLPADRRGAYCGTAAELEPILFAEIGKGDVVMVKGSNGSRMGPLVAALKARQPETREGSMPGRLRQGQGSF